jgi:hypothetical protein
MTRPWLPYPARRIGPPPPCPTGLDRYSSHAHALTALMHGLGETRHEPRECDQCAGWHHARKAT